MRMMRGAAEHELDVGHRQLRPRLDEGVQAARHHGRGTGAVEIGHQHAHRHAVEAHLAVEHAGTLARIGHVGADVVLQILSDRQIGDAGDSHLAQMRGRADAGQHQELRRVERAARQDHFARRVGTLAGRRSPDAYSTPVARVPCIETRVACAPVSTVRFGRFFAGRR